MPDLNLPRKVEQFLKRPNAAVIATLRPDGYPMTVVTWYDWEDGRVLVNMNEVRSRLAWMRRDPRVSLTVFDDDWYRHVSLYGDAVDIRPDLDLMDIDRLAMRYTGRRFGDREAKRVSAWIEPKGWHGWDDSGELASRG